MMAVQHECEYKLIMEGQDSNIKRLMADLKPALQLLRDHAKRHAAYRNNNPGDMSGSCNMCVFVANLDAKEEA